MTNVCEACGADNLEIDVNCARCGGPLLSTGVHRMVGSRVLEYVIVGVLGQGGMSVVYKAEHQVTHQEVALKVLPRELAAHSQVKSRFLEEARALARLDHRSIVHLYAFGEADGCLVLAMQYVRGQTFERMILERERLPWQDAVRVAIDVLEALEYAHSRGIVHRDMKPSNVLVREDNGAATVMDFGIAKMRSSSKLTATGQTMGTVRYMSPEQVRGKEVDARTDIYSLGASLYEAVVGDTPFDGDTHFEIMTRHLNDEPVPPSQRGVELPPGLEAVIMQSLRKPREERFATASEFRIALQEVLAGREPAAIAPDPYSVTAPRGAVQGIPSELEAAVDQTRPVSRGRQGARGPVLWIGLASVVVAASAAVFLLADRDAGESVASAVRPAVATAATDSAPAGPPPPFLVDGLTPAVDQSYPDAALRVMSIRPRDPAPIAAAIVGARERFLAALSQRAGAAAAIEPRHLNVVVVPEHVLCDRRVYESAESYRDCEQRESYYRPLDRTLYVADNGRLLDVNLPSEIALQICLDVAPSVQVACTDAFTEFERRLPRRR